MKAMKRLSVFLLAALVLVMTAIPAFAASVYTPATVNPIDTTVSHTLELTESPYNLGETITYKFEVKNGVTIKEPSGVTAADVVEGNPTFSTSTVTYNSADDFSTGEHKVSKNLTVNWNDVKFKQPGIYYWEVNKTLDSSSTATLSTTNESETTYLWAYVTDQNGTLTVSEVGISTDNTLGTKVVYGDQYPAKKVDLSVGKTVTGEKSSRDQFFKFTITVTLPQNVATQNYTITGLSTTAEVQASPYESNKSATQPTDVDNATEGTQVSLAAGENEITVWLKHGETAKIAGLPYLSSYSITESENDGYKVTTAVTGDQKNGTGDGNDIATGTGNNVVDSSLEKNTTVTYTNEKEGTTPTGIILQYGAPIAGILLVGIFMAFVLVGKKRRNQEA